MSTCECFRGTPTGYYEPKGSYQIIGGLNTYRCFDTTVVDYFEGNALPDCFMKYTPGTNVDEYDSLTIEVVFI
ncbi:unnamed protein product [Clonostachys rosea]|uniref:Uncharacterized protein n=1 Tax=Bionectria ochroleuca TaxID=29856 RepID=A0ABY6U3S4_BIOOC|nr:unnamed protein product [Clonostachys rosea]